MSIELSEDDIFLPAYRGRLTEGISYNKNNNSVLWVDIILAELHRVFLDTNEHQVMKHPTPGESIGTMGFTNNDDIYIVATKNGISKANFLTKEFTLLVKYPDQNPKLRSNDGKVDPWGNFIVGTMYDFPYENDIKPEGTLYRINPQLGIEVLQENCYVPNGLGFNSDKTKFYWIDSATQAIWVFDYDVATHKLSNRHKFFNVAEKIGSIPDGMFVSDKQELWFTTFGGSKVVRLNANGDILQTFVLPAKQVTCVTIANDEIFINTCLQGSSDFSIKSNLTLDGDLGGYLFRYKLKDVGSEPQYVFPL